MRDMEIRTIDNSIKLPSFEDKAKRRKKDP